MTSPLIAPLIPPRARPGGRERGRPGTVRRLPVAAVPAIPAVPDDVVYGLGRIDASGRVADRAITSALGWRPGDRLALAAEAGVVMETRPPQDQELNSANRGLLHRPGVLRRPRKASWRLWLFPCHPRHPHSPPARCR